MISSRGIVQTITVNSLGELFDRCTPNEPDPASGRLRDNSVYRGVPQANARLLTSLDRLGGSEPAHTKAHLEEHLLRNFLRYGNPFLPGTQSPLQRRKISSACLNRPR